MNSNKDCKLVKIYCYVCDKYGDPLQYSCRQFGNNSEPKDFYRDMSRRFGSGMLTPVKAVKGMPDILNKIRPGGQRPVFKGGLEG